MIDRKRFDQIQKDYGHYASWGVWAEVGERPKENVGDLSILDPSKNPDLLKVLNPNIVLVGLNISGRIKIPLGNFHSSSSRSHDYKIRYALKNSPFWGCYITDVIKDFEQKCSGKMMRHLRSNKDFEAENIRTFLKELQDIGASNPTVVAFGNDAYAIIKRNIPNMHVHKVTHYSAAISKENLRLQFEALSQ